MALITCPECGKQISDKAQHCIHCGYPMYEDNNLNNKIGLNLIINGQLQDVSEIEEYLTDYRFAKIHDIFNKKYGASTNDILDLAEYYLKHNNLPQALTTTPELHDKKEFKKNLMKLINIGIDAKHSENKNKDSQNDIIPKCPTCGSANLKKISAGAKAMNTLAFGVLGTKRNKTFHCNNCGYEW